MAGPQESFGRFKGCRSKAKGLDEQCGGPADGLIVVNYRDQILCHSESLTDLKVFAEGERIYWALVDLGPKKDDASKLSLTRLFPRDL